MHALNAASVQYSVSVHKKGTYLMNKKIIKGTC